MILTIAVPTYQRVGPLAAVLARLAPQLRGRCRLLVLDNASPDPALPVVAAAGLDALPEVEVVRHAVNVGAHANVHRAFEGCRTPWVWVLGDDDLPTPEAVDTILTAIAEDPEAACLNFLTTAQRAAGMRRAPVRSRGLAEFADRLDSAHHLNFMSSSVWRVATVVPHLRRSYHYTYSMSWVFALLLPATSDGGAVVLRPEAIIEDVSLAPEAERWSHVDFVLGFNTVLEAPMPMAVRRVLAPKLLGLHSPERTVAFLLAGLQGADGATARWTYRNATGRLAAYAGPLARLRYWAYRPLFWWHRPAWRAVRAVIAAAQRLRLLGVDVRDLDGRSAALQRV